MENKAQLNTLDVVFMTRYIEYIRLTLARYALGERLLPLVLAAQGEGNSAPNWPLATCG